MNRASYAMHLKSLNSVTVTERRLTAISRSFVSLIMCTGGAFRPFVEDRHLSVFPASRSAYRRSRRMASSGKLAGVRALAYNVFKSSGTSPNFRNTVASLKSPVAGSPVRLNATAPT